MGADDSVDCSKKGDPNMGFSDGKKGEESGHSVGVWKGASTAETRWQITTPARLILAGPSQAGKSTLLVKLATDDSVWKNPFKSVFYVSPGRESRESRDKYISAFHEKCKKVGKTFISLDKLPARQDLMDFSGGRHIFLIIDDALGFQNLETIDTYYTEHSHHDNISVALCVQNLYPRTRKLDMVTMVRNASGVFLFYQVSDLRMYNIFAQGPFPGKSKFFNDCLKKAKMRYGLRYVFVNFHPDSGIDPSYMCYTAIFAEERGQFGGSPLFFDANKT